MSKYQHALPFERDVWGTCMPGVHAFGFAADLATSVSNEMSYVTFLPGNFRLTVSLVAGVRKPHHDIRQARFASVDRPILVGVDSHGDEVSDRVEE